MHVGKSRNVNGSEKEEITHGVISKSTNKQTNTKNRYIYIFLRTSNHNVSAQAIKYYEAKVYRVTRLLFTSLRPHILKLEKPFLTGRVAAWGRSQGWSHTKGSQHISQRGRPGPQGASEKWLTRWGGTRGLTALPSFTPPPTRSYFSFYFSASTGTTALFMFIWSEKKSYFRHSFLFSSWFLTSLHHPFLLLHLHFPTHQILFSLHLLLLPLLLCLTVAHVRFLLQFFDLIIIKGKVEPLQEPLYVAFLVHFPASWRPSGRTSEDPSRPHTPARMTGQHLPTRGRHNTHLPHLDRHVIYIQFIILLRLSSLLSLPLLLFSLLSLSISMQVQAWWEGKVGEWKRGTEARHELRYQYLDLSFCPWTMEK